MARLIDRLHGYEKIWGRLTRQKEEARMPHALAFTGAGNPEKEELAWAFAQLLVCERTPAPCGECGACRRVETRESESVLFIAPEKNAIKLEAAHQILDFLSLQKVSRARVVVLDQAHLLNVQTANALLKAVEEPPPDTYFVMITGEISQLLPTLRSRVQSVRFGAQEEPPDEDTIALRTLARQFLSDAAQDKRDALDQIQGEAKDRELALNFVRQIQHELRAWTHANAALAPEALRPRTDLWQAAYKVEMDVLANVDRPLLFENFFYRVRAALS